MPRLAVTDHQRQSLGEVIIASCRKQQEAQLISSLQNGLQQLETLPTIKDMTPEMKANGTAVYKIGALQIDSRAHKVQLKGEDVILTPSEYDVLLVLAQRLGQVVEYGTLVKLALNYDAEPWEAKELIKRHIYTLRQKLETDPTNPRYIHNVRSVGYWLDVG